MSKTKDIVILVGSASGSALALIRAIKKEVVCKAYVLCISARVVDVLSSSKYVDELIHINGDTEQKYIDSVINWYAKQDFPEKPILYFNNDTACYYVDNNRQWFEERFELCLPSSQIVKSFTQKGIAEVTAEQAGLDVPKTVILNNEDDISKVKNEFIFPIILKPRATYLNNDINFKIKVIDNREEFITFSKTIVNKGNTLLCQEFIPGGNDVSYYYLFYRSRSGEIIDNIGRKTMQSSPKGGIMVKGISEYNKALVEISHQFLKNIDYRGIGGIEYKKHNGKYYFIEMSTRMEGFLKIAEISNSPLSLASYYDMIGNRTAVSTLMESKQIDGMIYFDYISLIINRVKQFKVLSFIAELFSVLFNRRVKINICERDDMNPFWITVKQLIFR